MKDFGSEGHKKHYEDLVKDLKTKDIAALAAPLDLPMSDAGEAEISFLGTTYLISNKGVQRSDRKKFPIVTGSALIHYLLKSSSCRPAGKFMALDELAGPLFKGSSFSRSALESPIVKRFWGRLPELLSIAASIGGREGGTSGLGSVSLIFDLLPNMLLQLIFYDQDDEFPARTTLLIDANATKLIDFEALAFLVAVFVQFLTSTGANKGLTFPTNSVLCILP